MKRKGGKERREIIGVNKSYREQKKIGKIAERQKESREI